ncbi:hypothetical protein RIF29_24505 [Crotalaria pallida]|uniref:Uncharacterized protein n=1 Tax=Crotalaria pallida TaxID=3830 RepID=A0AAN9EMD9_CROPI
MIYYVLVLISFGLRWVGKLPKHLIESYNQKFLCRAEKKMRNQIIRSSFGGHSEEEEVEEEPEVQGKFYYRVDPLGEGAKWRRTFGQKIYSPLLLAFSEKDDKVDWLNSHVPTFSGIDSSYALPDNIAIITLQELENGTTLLRLAHLYEISCKGLLYHLSIVSMSLILLE